LLFLSLSLCVSDVPQVVFCRNLAPGEGQEGRGFSARALLADEPTTGLDAFQAIWRIENGWLNQQTWGFMVI
jgi:hypothetical protein